MLEHWRPIVAAFVGQFAGRAEHLHHTDDAKEEEDHPDDLVSLEDST